MVQKPDVGFLRLKEFILNLNQNWTWIVPLGYG